MSGKLLNVTQRTADKRHLADRSCDECSPSGVYHAKNINIHTISIILETRQLKRLRKPLILLLSCYYSNFVYCLIVDMRQYFANRFPHSDIAC